MGGWNVSFHALVQRWRGGTASPHGLEAFFGEGAWLQAFVGLGWSFCRAFVGFPWGLGAVSVGLLWDFRGAWFAAFVWLS